MSRRLVHGSRDRRDWSPSQSRNLRQDPTGQGYAAPWCGIPNSRFAASLRPRRGGGLDGDRRGALRCCPAQALRAPRCRGLVFGAGDAGACRWAIPLRTRPLSCQDPHGVAGSHRGHPAFGGQETTMAKQ